jgi:hypothetical protein
MIALNTYPGELEETAGDLELCRRKLATLRSQKDAAAAPPTPGSVQLGVKIEGGDRGSGTDKISREARELEAALEETKVQLMILLAGCTLFAFHTCESNTGEVRLGQYVLFLQLLICAWQVIEVRSYS